MVCIICDEIFFLPPPRLIHDETKKFRHRYAVFNDEIIQHYEENVIDGRFPTSAGQVARERTCWVGCPGLREKRKLCFKWLLLMA